MLPELHDVLKEVIYEQGRIDRAEVDITFEVPGKEWADRLTRPTVNLYLFELQENMDLRQAQFQSTRSNGHTQLRAAPRRIDLRYVVTAMTSSSDDTFRLLWHVLGVLLRTPEIDASRFQDDIVLEAPIVTKVAQGDGSIKILDVWSALSTEPRAAFCYVVTLPVDLQLTFEYPFVLGRTLTYHERPRNGGAPVELESRTLIEGVVRTPAGAPCPHVIVATVDEPSTAATTNADGRYSLRTRRDGKLMVRLTGSDGRSSLSELDLDGGSGAFDLVLE